MILPAACICCRATVARLMPSDPVPMPDVTSPRVRMIAAPCRRHPRRDQRRSGSLQLGNSNGVVAAKSFILSRNDCAFSAEPSIVVKEIDAFSLAA